MIDRSIGILTFFMDSRARRLVKAGECERIETHYYRETNVTENKTIKQTKRDQLKKICLSILVVLALGAYFALAFVYGEKGYMRYMELRAEEAQLQDELIRLEDDNNKLLRQISRLKTDPNEIEQYARQMGYQIEGEIVFKFKEQP
jgi:cell division protein FtsB